MFRDSIEKTLACPNCKGPVTINVEERDEIGIQSGTVICKRCKREFSISDGIFYLRMLTKVTDNRGEAWSLNEFEERYDTLPVYKSAVEWGNLT